MELKESEIWSWFLVKAGPMCIVGDTCVKKQTQDIKR
jgi:hypothetical protein